MNFNLSKKLLVAFSVTFLTLVPVASFAMEKAMPKNSVDAKNMKASKEMSKKSTSSMKKMGGMIQSMGDTDEETHLKKMSSMEQMKKDKKTMEQMKRPQKIDSKKKMNGMKKKQFCESSEGCHE